MCDSNKIRVDVTGAPETMLATLYARALDADADHPILGDTYAKELVARLDYDWSKTSITERNAPSVATRGAHFDRSAREFLAVHEEATVLHLGCGLDSRALRVRPGPGIEWYDIDYPEVVALRERFYPPAASYRLIGVCVTELDWLSAISADRPVLLIAEGLTMYLTEESGLALLGRVVERFPSGELRLLAAMSVFDDPVFGRLPRRYRVMAKLMSLVPSLKGMAQYHRYAF